MAKGPISDDDSDGDDGDDDCRNSSGGGGQAIDRQTDRQMIMINFKV